MKVCTKCHASKNENEFFVKDKETSRLHAQCKLCYKEHRKTYMAEHYRKYGEQYRERAKERRARLKRSNQIKLISYMRDKQCTDCGENNLIVLEFDHIPPHKKIFGIARAINDGVPWEQIEQEITKCEVVCSNCHKKRTASRTGWFKALSS